MVHGGHDGSAGVSYRDGTVEGVGVGEMIDLHIQTTILVPMVILILAIGFYVGILSERGLTKKNEHECKDI